ncbi:MULTISPECIES: CAP domain-containing protein [unclassified Micromonospora]|uniref:CAP domain-containing protein n=1 Tax=unclassified Micromonospora TaxID=2617518 RepID=UPI00188F7F7F|nr:MULTISPECIES: CAP domain-containing protein [unclassified Micromonospora]MBF5029566.1 CAP domain-containing protein [Micromonospora sp. ANENR4]MCZ7473724.1 CAP domain-containing protein [Micromonospora sp. WMMC273]WBC04398.1 CAP domain-containing protein [Micromonospora sp. WMMA1976]
MYRWNDPIEPEDARRRPEPPTDEGPAWLSDRPEPRSSYLFGDDAQRAPAGPAHAGYGPENAPPAPRDRWNGEEQPTTAWHGQQPAWHGQEPAWQGREQPAAWQGHEQPAGGWEQPTTTWQPATDTPADDRRRPKRRLSRPLVIGGAAAAATLVVSLGVGAVLLPGDDQGTKRTSADAPVAAAPQAPDGSDDAPADAPAPESASPSAVPTTAAPSPTKKATPKPSRSTAPSRQQERSSAPGGGSSSGGSSGGSTSTKATATTGLSTELQKVVTIVNQERAKAGCKALTVNAKLNLAAQRHSQDQADHQKMDHTGSDGSQPWDRVKAAGYSYRMVGENVAWNYQTPAAVMEGWMNSEGHRKNILNCSYTQIGVGVARSNGPYWTQVFATPS